MENVPPRIANPPAIVATEPYAFEHMGPPDPGDWLLTPIPLAVLCFGIAAIAARFAGRRFESVGAAVALTAGLAIIAILQNETERLLENARIHWMWLAAVALLGIAGGSAARISEPVKSSPERLRFSARIVLRMGAATLLGSAVMLAPAVLFAVAMELRADDAVRWLSFLAVVGGIAFGGWIVGRLTPRYPVVCAVLAVYIPALLARAVFARNGELDVLVGMLAVISIPASVCAYIAGTRSASARTEREREAQGFGSELIRVSAFGFLVAALLTGVWSMSRDTCGMQRETFAWRVSAVKNVSSPTDAVDTLAESGLEARHVAGGVDDYRIEIDEPESVCNMFSRRTIVAQYPPAD